jgi:hypothetical protein
MFEGSISSASDLEEATEPKGSVVPEFLDGFQCVTLNSLDQNTSASDRYFLDSAAAGEAAIFGAADAFTLCAQRHRCLT